MGSVSIEAGHLYRRLRANVIHIINDGRMQEETSCLQSEVWKAVEPLQKLCKRSVKRDKI